MPPGSTTARRPKASPERVASISAARRARKDAGRTELHADGRLEVSLHASAGEQEQQFVAFDSTYLDQLLLKFAAQGA